MPWRHKHNRGLNNTEVYSPSPKGNLDTQIPILVKLSQIHSNDSPSAPWDEKPTGLGFHGHKKCVSTVMQKDSSKCKTTLRL